MVEIQDTTDNRRTSALLNFVYSRFLSPVLLHLMSAIDGEGSLRPAVSYRAVQMTVEEPVILPATSTFLFPSNFLNIVSDVSRFLSSDIWRTVSSSPSELLFYSDTFIWVLTKIKLGGCSLSSGALSNHSVLTGPLT